MALAEGGTRNSDDELVEVTQIFTGGKSFWRTGKTLDVVMFEHNTLSSKAGSSFNPSYIEVVVYDPELDEVAPHFYLSVKALFMKISNSFEPRGKGIKVKEGTKYTLSLIVKYVYDKIGFSTPTPPPAPGLHTLPPQIILMIQMNDILINNRHDFEIDKPISGLGKLPLIPHYPKNKENWDQKIKLFQKDAEKVVDAISIVTVLEQKASAAMAVSESIIGTTEAIASAIDIYSAHALIDVPNEIEKVINNFKNITENKKNSLSENVADNDSLKNVHNLNNLKNFSVPNPNSNPNNLKNVAIPNNLKNVPVPNNLKNVPMTLKVLNLKNSSDTFNSDDDITLDHRDRTHPETDNIYSNNSPHNNSPHTSKLLNLPRLHSKSEKKDNNEYDRDSEQSEKSKIQSSNSSRNGDSREILTQDPSSNSTNFPHEKNEKSRSDGRSIIIRTNKNESSEKSGENERNEQHTDALGDKGVKFEAKVPMTPARRNSNSGSGNHGRRPLSFLNTESCPSHIATAINNFNANSANNSIINSKTNSNSNSSTASNRNSNADISVVTVAVAEALIPDPGPDPGPINSTNYISNNLSNNLSNNISTNTKNTSSNILHTSNISTVINTSHTNISEKENGETKNSNSGKDGKDNSKNQIYSTPRKITDLKSKEKTVIESIPSGYSQEKQKTILHHPTQQNTPNLNQNSSQSHPTQPHTPNYTTQPHTPHMRKGITFNVSGGVGSIGKRMVSDKFETTLSMESTSTKIQPQKSREKESEIRQTDTIELVTTSVKRNMKTRSSFVF